MDYISKNKVLEKMRSPRDEGLLKAPPPLQLSPEHGFSPMATDGKTVERVGWLFHSREDNGIITNPIVK